MNTTLNEKLQKTMEKLRRLTVNHHLFDDIKSQIFSAIEMPNDDKILVVVGCSGVGKTRLIESISRQLEQNMADDGSLPYVRFEVPSPQTAGRFSWKHFHKAYLDGLQDPFGEAKRVLPPLPDECFRGSEEYAVLNALEHRKPKVVFLDEANHLALVKSSSSLLAQMSYLKSFVNRSGVLHVLFGTYELANLVRLSGQLARRCRVIHFGRYRSEVISPHEFGCFSQMVKSYGKHLPCTLTFKLESLTPYLHERTIGSTGILKSWLMRALSHAAKRDRDSISKEDLEATAMDIVSLRNMLEEALRGEAQFFIQQTEMTEMLGSFREAFQSATYASRAATAHAEDTEPFQLSSEDPPRGRKKIHAVKPGIPNPVRYPVGV